MKERFDKPLSALDQATHNRLAKLASMPVDTSRLDDRLRRLIPHNPWRDRTWRFAWPMRAAAVIIIVCSIAFALSLGSTQLLASPAELAGVHQSMLADGNRMAADSIDAANQLLANHQEKNSTLPHIDQAQVQCCCIRHIKNKSLSCVLLNSQGHKVTLAVANAAGMKMPTDVPVETRNGINYRIQACGSLNMVMTECNGRWMCLTGELSSDRLLDIASQLKF